MTKLYALFQNAPLTSEGKIKLAVVGEWKGHPAGEFALSLNDLERIKNNFESQKIDLVIDYEHQTLTGAEAPAAGWIKSLSIEGEALLATVEWTAKASERLKAKEYRYISPVLAAKTIDPVKGIDIGWSLHSAGLTNKPFLEELGELAVNKKPPSQQTKGEMEMDQKEADALKARADALEAENKAIKASQEAARDKAAETIVGEFIANKKLDAALKEKALAFCKQDAEGFKALIAGVLVEQKQTPKNDIYANKNAGGEADKTEYTDLAKYV
jgi:phage I-like protein